MRRRRTLLFYAMAVMAVWSGDGAQAATFRDDRVPLNGEWRFQLRRDNRLLTAGPVEFGPVTASSQAAMIEPYTGGETSAGRWITSTPVPLAATIIPSEGGSSWSRQIWKPHPRQQGGTWWRIDLGPERTMRTVAGIRVNWVAPPDVTVRAELSSDGVKWAEWASSASERSSVDTWIRGIPERARYVRLHFTPAMFPGTRLIEVFLKGPDGALTPWLPLPRMAWYEKLRQYTPSDGFHLPDFDDASWSGIQVPSYWELAQFSEPTWWQPDDAVGYYRRVFTLPENWRGRQVRLRFEGVNNSARVWVNGQEIGYHESGFTVFEFDVTAHLKFGQPNTIAVRVCKWTLTHEYDTDDVWFLGGIWRDTYLYSLPARRIDDYTLVTELDEQYRDAVLRARLVLAGDAPFTGARYEVEGELKGPDGGAVPVDGLKAEGLLDGRAPLSIELAGRVRNPLKWTAETPHLYALTLRLRVEGSTVHEFSTAIGFRQVEVKGDRILLNGVPLRVQGTVTTRANPNDSGEDLKTVFAREIRILKESNINMIRSHTTPLEEDFLDLCDKHGIYVVPDVPAVWLNEGDYRNLAGGAVQRAREIHQQHKNRASVVMWHIGNENGPSSGYRPMGQAARWLSDNDPTRPVALCDNEASLAEYGAAVKDFHFYGWPPLEPTAAPFLMGEFHGVPEEADRLKDRGFVESWGRSLKKGWDTIAGKPWIVGALICCWDDGSVNGNLGPRQWGLLDSKRHAKDLAFHVRKVYARVHLELADARLSAGRLNGALHVFNRYSYVDLSGHTFRWELLAGGRTAASGLIQCRVNPQSSTALPLSLTAPEGSEILRISVSDREGFLVQSEDFALTPEASGRKAASLLSHIGFTRRAGKPREFEYAWKAGGLSVRGRDSAEWLTIPGLVVQTGKDRRTNIPLGEVHYGVPSHDAGKLIVPFTIAESRGRLIFEEGANFLKARYEFTAANAMSIREIGLALRLPVGVKELAWNRAPLWNSAPAGWLDGPRGMASPEALAETVSRRDLHWLAFEAARRPILIAPSGDTMNLRFDSPPRGIVLSEFLSSQGFLGKYDLATIGKKVAAGETLSGGTTIYLLPPRSWAALSGNVERD